MKIIVNNNNTYDIGHDDSINEYLLYIATDDGVMTKAVDKIYGETVLADTVSVLSKQYNSTETIYIPYGKTTEQGLYEIQS